MTKKVTFNEEARASLKRGIDLLTLAVRITLGPKGRNVAIEHRMTAPTITHDGVTVAKEIELEDVYENMGVMLLREAATKTNDVAGDGTTTATILAHAIVHEGMKNVAAGANSMQLRHGIERASEVIVQAIKDMAISVEGKQEIAQIAAISAADSVIGDLIATVMDRVGKDGVVTVEESKGWTDEVSYVEGMQFDRGYISPQFCTNPDQNVVELEEPYFLLTDKKISAIGELLPILEKVVKSGRKELVIVAEDVDGEALAGLIVNKTRGILNVLAVRAPSFGEKRKEMLRDLAIVTGGEVISEELGRRVEQATLKDLGRARRVLADKDNTTIVEGRGEPQEIQKRAKQIRALLEITSVEFDREKLQQRLAQLAGGVAVIRVGAASDLELKEKKHRIEDAVSATRAAIEEGIVPGGGVALLAAASALDSLKLRGDERTGVAIVRQALEAPMRQIARNAGEEGAVIVQNVRRKQTEERNGRIGYNVLTNVYGDMVKMGIIDPAKVTRSAVENAASVAILILTTEALVADIPEFDPSFPIRPSQYGDF